LSHSKELYYKSRRKITFKDLGHQITSRNVQINENVVTNKNLGFMLRTKSIIQMSLNVISLSYILILLIRRMNYLKNICMYVFT